MGSPAIRTAGRQARAGTIDVAVLGDNDGDYTIVIAGNSTIVSRRAGKSNGKKSPLAGRRSRRATRPISAKVSRRSYHDQRGPGSPAPALTPTTRAVEFDDVTCCRHMDARQGPSSVSSQARRSKIESSGTRCRQKVRDLPACRLKANDRLKPASGQQIMQSDVRTPLPRQR